MWNDIMRSSPYPLIEGFAALAEGSPVSGRGRSNKSDSKSRSEESSSGSFRSNNSKESLLKSRRRSNRRSKSQTDSSSRSRSRDQRPRRGRSFHFRGGFRSYYTRNKDYAAMAASSGSSSQFTTPTSNSHSGNDKDYAALAGLESGHNSEISKLNSVPECHGQFRHDSSQSGNFQSNAEIDIGRDNLNRFGFSNPMPTRTRHSFSQGSDARHHPAHNPYRGKKFRGRNRYRGGYHGTSSRSNYRVSTEKRSSSSLDGPYLGNLKRDSSSIDSSPHSSRTNTSSSSNARGNTPPPPNQESFPPSTEEITCTSSVDMKSSASMALTSHISTGSIVQISTIPTPAIKISTVVSVTKVPPRPPQLPPVFPPQVHFDPPKAHISGSTLPPLPNPMLPLPPQLPPPCPPSCPNSSHILQPMGMHKHETSHHMNVPPGFPMKDQFFQGGGPMYGYEENIGVPLPFGQSFPFPGPHPPNDGPHGRWYFPYESNRNMENRDGYTVGAYPPNYPHFPTQHSENQYQRPFHITPPTFTPPIVDLNSGVRFSPSRSEIAQPPLPPPVSPFTAPGALVENVCKAAKSESYRFPNDNESQIKGIANVTFPIMNQHDDTDIMDIDMEFDDEVDVEVDIGKDTPITTEQFSPFVLISDIPNPPQPCAKVSVSEEKNDADLRNCCQESVENFEQEMLDTVTSGVGTSLEMGEASNEDPKSESLGPKQPPSLPVDPLIEASSLVRRLQDQFARSQCAWDENTRWLYILQRRMDALMMRQHTLRIPQCSSD